VADRVLVMENGVMVEQGATDDVIFNPQHEYTRRLLSDVPRLHEGAGPAQIDDFTPAASGAPTHQGGAHAI
jgi:peptide/nickel transport system ATP-binding protein